MNADIYSLTNLIVAVTCVVSYFAMQQQTLKSALIFHPVTISNQGQWYRFLSSGLIHADNVHLLVNMLVLWSFGNAIENDYYPYYLGDGSSVKFVILYLGGVVVASIPSFLRHKSNPNYAALGASGGVSAVVFAAIVFAPWQNLYLYGIIAIPQILAGLGYLYYSWYQDKKGQDNIGHMTHFTGAIWGFVFTCLMQPDMFIQFISLTLEGPSWL